MSSARLVAFPKAGERLPDLVVAVTATTVVLGAISSRDWRPMHHDHRFAQERNGVHDIFLNTPNQALWLERYLTDWAGARSRLGRIRFRMGRPVYPGEEMRVTGVVRASSLDKTGCAWIEVDLDVRADGQPSTTGFARVAVPKTEDDNPWSRRGDAWKP